MGATMSFDVDIATKLGVNSALLLQSIYFWCQRNEANERNIINGRAWTYNSMTAFCKQFPFISKKTIERTLNALEKDGYIETGVFNTVSFDRTKWYTMTQKGKMLFDKMAPSIETDCLVQNETDCLVQNETKRPNNTIYITDINRYKEKEIYKEKVEDDVPDLEIEVPKVKPKKKAYGEYKKVLLTDEELEKLKAEFPTNWQEWIDRVDGYCAQNGKQYKNFLATIRNWARRDKERGANVSGNGKRNEKPRVGETSEEGERFVDDFMSRLRQRYAERGVIVSG